MKKLFFSVIILACFSFTSENPKVTTYSYGHNGMEYIAKNKNSTIIVSTYNSKMTIRYDIATKLYLMYMDNTLENNKKITVCGEEADVTGKCIIRQNEKLTSVDFYYEVVEWKSGLKEIYKKLNKKGSQ